MLEVFINFICAIIMSLLGVYIIQKIIQVKVSLSFKNIIIVLMNAIIIVGFHYIRFNTFTSLFSFLINTITYKILFKKRYSESLVFTGILMIIIFISELIWLSMFVNFFSMNSLRNNIEIYLLTNVIIAMTSIAICNINAIKRMITKTYEVLLKKEKLINWAFIVLFIISASAVMYNITMNYHKNIFFLSNVIIMCVTLLIVIIYLYENAEYNKLSNEYDVLLSNVKNFEDWIEKEQFIGHEYKNQLAVLYELSKNKAIKNKIQEIINQNLNINNNMVYLLKKLPKGGLKAILYYKSIIAQNNKINLTVDVSVDDKGILTKLSIEQIDELAKILGIIFDNAIEAAINTRKKNILLEIYELKDKVNIVVSNTFQKNKIINNRYEKGISTKGSGRGNGLYFVKKILNRNNWIEEKQEIIDNYYIETITIKNTSKI